MQRRKIDYKKLVGYLLLVAGITFTAWLGRSVIIGVQTQDWPSSSGLIYQAEVSYTTSHPSDKRKKFYQSHFEYRYRIEKKAYSGTRIYLTDLPYLSEQDAQILIEKYPTGTLVKVYYDASDPSRAVLQTGNPPTLWLLLGTSLLFTALGFRLARKAG
ncbi:MAG: hypothetical protein ACJAVI_003582 [Candidatus Azotimanducaceae bacterium]|jgi:hypothetical protein